MQRSIENYPVDAIMAMNPKAKRNHCGARFNVNRRSGSNFKAQAAIIIILTKVIINIKQCVLNLQKAKKKIPGRMYAKQTAENPPTNSKTTPLFGATVSILSIIMILYEFQFRLDFFIKKMENKNHLQSPNNVDPKTCVNVII